MPVYLDEQGNPIQQGQPKQKVYLDDQGNPIQQTPQAAPAGDKSLLGFATNVGQSALNLGKGIYQTVAHPIDTAYQMSELGAGAIEKGLGHETPQTQKLDAAKQFLVNRYGGWENIKNTLYHDPIGFLADLSTVLGGVGAGAGAAGLGRTAAALRTAAGITDPIRMPVAAGGLAIAAPIAKATESVNPAGIQQAINFLKDAGVPLTLDLQTGNQVLKGAKGMLKHFPGSAGPLEENRTAVISSMENLGDTLAGGTTDKFAAGLEGRKTVMNAVNKERGTAGQAYEQLYAEAGKPENVQQVQIGTRREGKFSPQRVPVYADVATPVDMRATKAAAQAVAKDVEKLIPAEQRQYSPGLGALKQVAGLDDFVSLEDANRSLSALKSIGRNDLPGFRSQSQRVANEITQPFHEAVRQAAESIGQEGTLARGAAATTEKYNLKDLARMAQSEPVKFLDKAVGIKDRNAEMLTELRQKFPDMVDKFGQATLEGILDQMFGRTGQLNRGEMLGAGALKRYRDLGEKTKEALFPDPAMRQKLDNFFIGADVVSKDVNPSGTGRLVALLEAFRHPVRSIPTMIGAKTMAKILMSDQGDLKLLNVLEKLGVGKQSTLTPLSAPGRLVSDLGDLSGQP